MTEPHVATDLDRRIDAARREYESLRDQLERSLARDFADAGEVADRLLSVVDEFGREHAMELMAERPDDYGIHYEEAKSGWRDTTVGYGAQVERLVDTHERLDALTAEREQLLRREDGQSGRVLNIQGREYAIETDRRQLRDITTGERHPVELERFVEPTPSLTQRAARQATVERAMHRPEKDRDRSRGS